MEPKKELADEIRIRLYHKSDPHLSAVLKYLEEKGFNLRYEIIELLKARFVPQAMLTDGKVDRAIAYASIGKLRSYIYTIEQLAGIPSIEQSTMKPISENSKKAEEFDEDDKDDFVNNGINNSVSDIKIDLDEMFGLKKSS